ncbi:MAG: hypothetical protein AABY88_11360 [Pseudomonadota bacterium]
MATQAPRRGAQSGRVKSDGTHEGFLRHKSFRWLKIAFILTTTATLGYLFIDVKPRPNGGSWYGYLLGIVSTLMIVWLTMLGVRKRIPSRKRWSLKGWTSAHIYLGISLAVIGTLHTGFQIDWNVHTLAYVLMMLVILSGLWGITVYAKLPRQMSLNREELTENQMLEGLRSMDRQLHDAAQPLDHRYAELVRKSLQEDPFGGGLLRRILGLYRTSKARKTLAQLSEEIAFRPGEDNPIERLDALLERKENKVRRLRKHLQYKARLEVWLYFHVPLTFALIAALSAHIVSVFFYW